jgi:hypothetical protein
MAGFLAGVFTLGFFAVRAARPRSLLADFGLLQARS